MARTLGAHLARSQWRLLAEPRDVGIGSQTRGRQGIGGLPTSRVGLAARGSCPTQAARYDNTCSLEGAETVLSGAAATMVQHTTPATASGNDQRPDKGCGDGVCTGSPVLHASGPHSAKSSKSKAGKGEQSPSSEMVGEMVPLSLAQLVLARDPAQ